VKETKKFMSNIDYNKSSKACKKIDNRVNNRKLSEIKIKEVPHILKVFNF